MHHPHVPGASHKSSLKAHSHLGHSNASHSIVQSGVKLPRFLSQLDPPGDPVSDSVPQLPSISEVCLWDRWLNDLLVGCHELSLCESIEQSLQKLFKAEKRFTGRTFHR
jgi:hypothetical protein